MFRRCCERRGCTGWAVQERLYRRGCTHVRIDRQGPYGRPPHGAIRRQEHRGLNSKPFWRCHEKRGCGQRQGGACKGPYQPSVMEAYPPLRMQKG